MNDGEQAQSSTKIEELSSDELDAVSGARWVSGTSDMGDHINDTWEVWVY